MSTHPIVPKSCGFTPPVFATPAPPPAVGQRWRTPEGDVSVASVEHKTAPAITLDSGRGIPAHPVVVILWSDGRKSECPPDFSQAWPPTDGVLLRGNE